MEFLSFVGVTVIYDSKIHGSFDRIMDRTDQQYGEAREIGEEELSASFREPMD